MNADILRYFANVPLINGTQRELNRHTKKQTTKCTWPTQEFCVWDPTQPIFALGVGGGGGGWADLTRSPNASSIASQWNMGLNSTQIPDDFSCKHQ